MLRNILLIIVFSAFTLLVNAQLKLASILDDNMVLQRNSEVKLWGTGTAGEKMTVSASWSKEKYKTKCEPNGKWMLKVPTSDAGGPYWIEISTSKEKLIVRNILLGEVWLAAGQSNMAIPIQGYKDQPVNGAHDILENAGDEPIRLYNIPNSSQPEPIDSCGGKWMPATSENVQVFSAVGYLFAKHLQQKLKVPVGVIISAWGGSWIESWINREAIIAFPDAVTRSTLETNEPNQRASQLYNGMIAPITNYSIKGIIWYQGESNIVNYKGYDTLMKAMVSGWRNKFEQGIFPFYFVQIAPYDYGIEKNSAFLREEQSKAMGLIPNSGMITTIDLGEKNCVHPAEKNIVAKRLSWWAIAETYGIKGIPYKSPVYHSQEVKDTMIIISFDNAEQGITTFGKKLESLEIAGIDRIFYSANVLISDKKLIVWNPKVNNPVAVRYAFSNFPKGDGFLYNLTGLPVSSFRTDNWEQ